MSTPLCCSCLISVLSPKLLQNALQPENLKDIPFISFEWLVDCFEAGELLCWDPYKVAVTLTEVPNAVRATPAIQEERSKKKLTKNNLTFLTPNPGHSSNNGLIVEKLQKMADFYRVQGQYMKSLAYKKAIANIKTYPNPIDSIEDAISIHGVGKKIAGHVCHKSEYFLRLVHYLRSIFVVDTRNFAN